MDFGRIRLLAGREGLDGGDARRISEIVLFAKFAIDVSSNLGGRRAFNPTSVAAQENSERDLWMRFSLASSAT